MKVAYTTLFIRLFNKLPPDLQEEVLEKIEMFEKDHKHTSFKMHALKGRLKGKFSIRINYSYRIVFEIIAGEAMFLEIGNHDIYK